MQKVFQVRRCESFLILLKFKDKIKMLLNKLISDKKEMSESINTETINDTESEYASVEDLLNMHRTASKVTTLASTIPNIINLVLHA